MNSLYQLNLGMRFSCGDNDDGMETFVINKISPKGMEITSEKTEEKYLIPINLTVVAMVEPIFESQLK